METQLTTTIPASCFPAELRALTFSADAGAAVPVRLTLAGEDILDLTLYADNEGRVELLDLTQLLQERMTSIGPHQLEIWWGEGLHYSMETTLLPCRADVGAAETFLPRHFLSLCDGRRRIPATATEEYLAWYHTEAADSVATVRSGWYDSTDGSWYEGEQTLAAQNLNDVDFISIEPAAVMRPENVPRAAQLATYEVSVGRRRQQYEVIHGQDATLGVSFLNAFLAEEDFYFLGTLEHELKTERSAARFRGRLRNYAVESYDELKAATGVLPDGMLPVLCDLATTLQAWRISDGRELVVTDSEARHTSDTDHLPSATVTFRESLRPDRRRPRDAVRTFDKTFDETYE